MNPVNDFVVFGIMLSVVLLGVASVVLFKLVLPHAQRYKRSIRYFMGFFVFLSLAFIAFLFIDNRYHIGNGSRFESSVALFANTVLYTTGLLSLRHGFVVRKQQHATSLWKSDVLYINLLTACTVQHVLYNYFPSYHDIRISVFNLQLALILLSIAPFVSTQIMGDRLIRYTVYAMVASLVFMSVPLFFETTYQFYHVAVMCTQLLNYHVWMGILFILLLADSIKKHYENSLTDELTGLNNRRFFMSRLEEIQSNATDDCYASMILCDIDHFKRVNDIHGHALGDEVIRKFGKALNSEIREDDFLARIGGEEFAIFLPMTPLITAEHVAERMRKLVEERVDVTTLDGSRLKITASFGVSASFGKATASDFFNIADKAMYQAKQAGRNCVKTATSLEDVSSKPGSFYRI